MYENKKRKATQSLSNISVKPSATTAIEEPNIKKIKTTKDLITEQCVRSQLEHDVVQYYREQYDIVYKRIERLEQRIAEYEKKFKC